MRSRLRLAAVVLPLFLVPALVFAQPKPPAQPAQPGNPPAQPASAQPPSPPASSDLPPPPPPPDTTAPAPAQPPTDVAPSDQPGTTRGSLLPPGAGLPAAGAAPVLAADSAKPDAASAPSPSDKDQIYAEDWWTSARPVIEMHGYFRLRAELFHNFALGRIDPYSRALWPLPPDTSYADWSGNQTQHHDLPLCGSDPANPSAEFCKDKTQAGANVRFRLNPEVHVSDNLRILSQVDLLDNVVLGSTPDGYSNTPADGGGYQRVGRSGYTPLSAFYSSMAPPTAGVNSYQNSIAVKRVWGEYMTPIGQLRFGRMPSHWGLGMFVNSGDGFDSDYQSTADRIMFVTGLKSLDLYLAGAWDFPAEGATSASLNDQQGQPYDLAQLDDVSQYVLVLVRRRNAELQKLDLARGDVVLNGGVYFVFRNQLLAADGTGSSGQTLGATEETIQSAYVRRNAKAYIPDVWFQLLYRKFRFELEAVTVQGSMDSTEFSGYNYTNDSDPGNDGWKIRQYGIATQTEYKAVEDKLRLNFGFGWASGDPDVWGPKVGGLTPGFQGLQPQSSPDRTISTFRFHPDYRVDMILFRHILNRVQGTYYFRPSVDYDFTRSANGQKFGGGAAFIWSRASEFVQAPGHKRDLGIEIDLNLYFQSKDGSMNDDPDKMGGFYTMLQYGVLFPLGGLDYLPGEKEQAREQGLALDTSAAQSLRWYMGVFF